MSPGVTNTPASTSWKLYLTYTSQNTTEILEPTAAVLKLYSPTIDIWRLINWVFVSFYWIILYDFGQVGPTMYPYSGYTVPGSPIAVINTSIPATFYPPINNIFVNNTLFEIYSDYMRNTLLPIANVSLPEFSPLDSSNRLDPAQAQFLRTYNCLRRQSKGALSGIISVLAANYALFFGACSLFLLIAGWIQRRRPRGKFHLLFYLTM